MHKSKKQKLEQDIGIETNQYYNEMSSESDLDYQNEYSRLIHAVGAEALKKLQASNVLIVGLNGLGVEVAKNIILMGVKKLSLLDLERATWPQLSSNFFLTPEAVQAGELRVDVVFDKLKELNERVDMSIVSHIAPRIFGGHGLKKRASIDQNSSSSSSMIDDDDEVGDDLKQFIEKFSVVVCCDNRSKSAAVAVSRACHECNVKFVMADSRGLFGAVFCDFGDAHSVVDRDGEPPKSAYVNSIALDDGGAAIVHVVDSERHDLEDGDWVRVQGVQGAVELNDREFEVRVLGPYSLSLVGVDGSTLGAYEARGLITQVKKPVSHSYADLASSLAKYEWHKCAHPDGINDLRRAQFHAFYSALLDFQESHGGSTPRAYSAEDARELIALARDALRSGAADNDDVNVDEALLRRLSYVCAGDLNPMATFLGGVAAQEVMKATSGKFTPLDQWLFFDSLHSVPIDDDDARIDRADFAPAQDRYDGQTAVFGRRFQRRLGALRYFLVGSGAIGCEMLKNWALMGVGAGDGGLVTVTDMDTIEVSNLNRQFLFRAADVGCAKSEVAAEAARRMNPALRIEARADKVGADTEPLFDDAFWAQLGGVCNALDNVEARRYVDQRCVYFAKSLLESGTLGAKGNTQVVVPHMTESYSSTHDAPQAGIPICTLHSFPSKIEHTLTWARQILFEQWFIADVDAIRAYATDAGFVGSLPPATRRSTVERLVKDCVTERPATLDECARWARDQFEHFFHNKIAQLLYLFPHDFRDKKSGAPFWSGTKLPPNAARFSAGAELHVDFVVAAAFLRAYSLGIVDSELRPADYDAQRARLAAAAAAHRPPPFSPSSSVKINTDPASNDAPEEVADDDNSASDDDLDEDSDERVIAELLAKMPAPAGAGLASLGFEARPIDFEKDDDRNFHIDFINAASNVRALAYGIEPVDRLQSKLVAGRIIPAMITTTAAVTGLACFELYKLLADDERKRTIEQFKNTYINLGICIFQQSDPAPVEQLTYKDAPFTIWDSIHIRQGDLTLGQLIDYFREHEQIEVDMIGVGTALIYTSWMSADKRQDRLPRNFAQLVAEITKQPLRDNQTSMVIEVTGETLDGDEVEDSPTTVYHFK
jgi:ubiquitin-activating enzyme E1